MFKVETNSLYLGDSWPWISEHLSSGFTLWNHTNDTDVTMADKKIITYYFEDENDALLFKLRFKS